jgi:hypothetical protein
LGKRNFRRQKRISADARSQRSTTDVAR